MNLLNFFKKKRFKKKIKSLTVGVNVMNCKDCKVLNIGTQMYDLFDWSSANKAIRYDKETEEILIAEEQLMRMIQMVNSAQPTRKIKLVSQDELWRGRLK